MPLVTPSILLVDCIPDHTAQYAAALRDRGYRVAVVTAGGEALTAALDTPPCCAVIDLRLPDMSGWELCRRLKQEAATRDVPVVVLTPDTSRERAVESARVHCNAWIALPAQAADLVRAVEHVLAQGAAVPARPEEAVLGVQSCPACESDRVRATLRVRAIRYHLCRACGYGWRVEAIERRRLRAPAGRLRLGRSGC